MFGPFKMFDRLFNGWFGYVSWDVARYKTENLLTSFHDNAIDMENYDMAENYKKQIAWNAIVHSDVKKHLLPNISSIYNDHLLGNDLLYIAYGPHTQLEKGKYLVIMRNNTGNFSHGLKLKTLGGFDDDIKFERLGTEKDAEEYCKAFANFIEMAQGSNTNSILNHRVISDCSFGDKGRPLKVRVESYKTY